LAVLLCACGSAVADPAAFPLPFIPVPEIDVDPNSGTTLGLIPTWLVTDEHGDIHKIYAPDVLYNPYFGYGVRGRIFSYPSDDEQWSVVGGAKEKVESEFDFEYQRGRLRNGSWSFTLSAVYDRSGTPRFYGIGNNSPAIDETNYTEQQKYLQSGVGWNLSHEWQILYTWRARSVQVQPGTLASIASIQRRFAEILGLGIEHESLNRIAISYDTRDDPTVPRHGGAYVVYGGVAADDGLFDSSLYSVVGFDGRQLWPAGDSATIAAHAAVRYMPGETGVPFWSLSSIGGDQSVIGDAQPLRGYGTGRFYDRNSFAANLEYRRRILSVEAVSTHIDVELTPFVDAGRVFAHSRSSPFVHLHKVAGVGFRGIASPFVVGFVDIGYGSEGVAVFTGINYPF
jgi:outer membrane protein assembly factor BamA